MDFPETFQLNPTAMAGPGLESATVDAMWRLRLTLSAGLLAVSLLGCRKGDELSMVAKAAESDGAAASTTAEVTTSPASKGHVSAEEKAPVGSGNDLPALKPINDKPFPEGASEAQVCEAIDNTQEKDLWVRFGHLVPIHVFGSIFVVEAKGKSPDEVREFIRTHHYGWDSRTRFCDDSRALVYIRSFPNDRDVHGHIEGRETLSKQLRSELSVQVSESFSYPDDQERLSDYCRKDAEICEKLVKLDYANQGKGLCVLVGTSLGVSSQDAGYTEFLENAYSRIQRYSRVRTRREGPRELATVRGHSSRHSSGNYAEGPLNAGDSGGA